MFSVTMFTPGNTLNDVGTTGASVLTLTADDHTPSPNTSRFNMRTSYAVLLFKSLNKWLRICASKSIRAHAPPLSRKPIAGPTKSAWVTAMSKLTAILLGVTVVEIALGAAGTGLLMVSVVNAPISPFSYSAATAITRLRFKPAAWFLLKVNSKRGSVETSECKTVAPPPEPERTSTT